MKGVRAAGWIVLLIAGLVALFPDFFSPYPPAEQHRDLPYAPPGVHGRASIEWFAHREPYRWLGAVPASIRLFAVRGPGRLFLLGSDEFGRDWYSRLCHGASASLLIAPSAALLSILLAVGLGTWAGYSGGWIDRILMHASEVFAVLPWFYVVLALRAALPLTLGGPATLFAVFAVLAALGSASPARIVRGSVLSFKTRDFVLAARAAGATGGRVLRHHILPFVIPAVRTQFLLAVPVYIITEVTLSFLGLGVPDPTPTWGGMLTPLQEYVVLTSYPWMFAPAAAIVVVCLALQVVAGRDAGRGLPSY
jgi:peptide/nickel transport system permease protein